MPRPAFSRRLNRKTSRLQNPQVIVCCGDHFSDLMMPQQSPSIQSFFPKNGKTSSSGAGDGFTAEEVEAALHPPALPKWQPRGIYEEADIETLVPGPGCVALIGRVVNFFDQETLSKAPQAAKGCLKLVIKDDTGALVVGFSSTTMVIARTD